jgi:hypothetical protein
MQQDPLPAAMEMRGDLHASTHTMPLRLMGMGRANPSWLGSLDYCFLLSGRPAV